MADNADSGDSPATGGVFGNLPDARPGARSPRRRSSQDSDAPKRATKATPKRKPAAKRKPAVKRTPAPVSPETGAKVEPTRRPAAERPEPPGEGIGSVEDLAWAGVAAAAEAATLGVRLASRALDALRGTAERD